jgi:hypothetical protein
MWFAYVCSHALLAAPIMRFIGEGSMRSSSLWATWGSRFPRLPQGRGIGIANAVLFENLTGRLDELRAIENHGFAVRRRISEFESDLASWSSRKISTRWRRF